MNIGRRDFLKQLSAFIAGGFARSLAASTATAVTSTAAVSAAKIVPSTAAAMYGASVRAQVFEVIVRQGVAGAPWKQICAGPMQVNAITEDEVQAEIDRRRQLLEADPELQSRLDERRMQYFLKLEQDADNKSQ